MDPNIKETYFKMLRIKRNELLKETDIYMIYDYPISEEEKYNNKYRQELRDFFSKKI